MQVSDTIILIPRSLYSANTNKPTQDLVMAESKSTFSPRLGISFPITDEGIIHFSYGHFYQLPPFSYLIYQSNI